MKTFRFLFLGLLLAASFSIAHAAVGLADPRPIPRLCNDDGSCDSSGNSLGCRQGGWASCTCDLRPVFDEPGTSPYYCRAF